jgi:superfamily II DNA or RNA helicase
MATINEVETIIDGQKFKAPQMVALKSDRSKFGPILSVQSGIPEDIIHVFIDGISQTYHPSQLEPYIEEVPRFLSSEQFHAFLSALEILNPGMANLHSINAARVDFIPYQYRPVLRFIRADRPRMLIADSVGVGKTIEAGLILRELQARKDVNSILIICPKPLVTESKWLNEMKRFDEDFEHLDGEDLRYCIEETHIDGEWPTRKEKAIISYSKFNNDILNGQGRLIGLNKLSPPPHFDLVIVDEAHHVKNVETAAYKAVKFFCDNADAAIFLTATPIQLGDNDLFVLLNLLRPDLIIDRQSFELMAEPNQYINNAISDMRGQNSDWQKSAREFLDKAAETPWGRKVLVNNPDLIKVRERLLQNEISREDRVKIITTTENLHTFSGIINRTRRRDIDDFTTRHPETKQIPFTPAQQELHDSLLSVQAEIFRQIHGDKNIAFMMTTIRRQAASCIFGLKPYLEEMLTRHDDKFADDLLNDAVDDTFESDLDLSGIISIESQIEEIIALAQNLDDDDPKYYELKRIVEEKQKRENHRVMLFSSFRHTLYYLNERLKKDGFKVGLIHGGIPDNERVELRKRFEKSKEDSGALDVLLFSEVGCEGLDYQFCDCLVNYDLPWNPMRIEQRIGRIDRRGQKSDPVVIYNMVTPGTVDFDIYERCLWRIGVFKKSIGDCEEILGEIAKEIKSIGEDFNLNEEQRRKKLELLEDQKISRIQEIQRLEDEKYNFIGLELPKDQLNEEIENATNFWLGSVSIECLVNLYLQEIIGTKQEVILGKEPLKTLRLSTDVRNALLADCRKLHFRKKKVNTKWERWLQGSNQHLSITFESECAANNPDAVFLAPFHPFVQQAARHFTVDKKAIVNLEVSTNKVKHGNYFFAIYRWEYLGVREDRCFKIITDNDELAAYIDLLLREAKDSLKESVNISEQTINDFTTRHHAVWETAREEHLKENERFVNYQKQSLILSHDARIAVLKDRLVNAQDESIKRLLQGTIRNAEADFTRHLKALDEAQGKAELKFTPVVYGSLRIKGEADE